MSRQARTSLRALLRWLVGPPVVPELDAASHRAVADAAAESAADLQRSPDERWALWRQRRSR